MSPGQLFSVSGLIFNSASNHVGNKLSVVVQQDSQSPLPINSRGEFSSAELVAPHTPGLYKIIVDGFNNQTNEATRLSRVYRVVPEEVSSLQATTSPDCGGKVKLQWDYSNQATHYNIYRSQRESDPYTLISTTQSNGFIDSTEEFAADFYYIIQSLHAPTGLTSIASKP